MMPDSGLLRLAEASGVLSLATDLATGQSLEHDMRTAVLGVRTAAVLSLPEQDLAAVFYTGLLHFAQAQHHGMVPGSGHAGVHAVVDEPDRRTGVPQLG